VKEGGLTRRGEKMNFYGLVPFTITGRPCHGKLEREKERISARRKGGMASRKERKGSLCL